MDACETHAPVCIPLRDRKRSYPALRGGGSHRTKASRVAPWTRLLRSNTIKEERTRERTRQTLFFHPLLLTYERKQKETIAGRKDGVRRTMHFKHAYPDLETALISEPSAVTHFLVHPKTPVRSRSELMRILFHRNPTRVSWTRKEKRYGSDVREIGFFLSRSFCVIVSPCRSVVTDFEYIDWLGILVVCRLGMISEYESYLRMKLLMLRFTEEIWGFLVK